MAGEPPRFETFKDHEFKVAFVTGAFGTVNADNGQLIFFVDEPQVQAGQILPGKGPEMLVPVVRRTFIIDIRMSPGTFRSLSTWMAGHVKNFDENLAQGKKPDPGPSYG